MAACSDHKEMLVMDVHGELAPEERIAWEGHLRECADCRSERESLCAIIRNAKEVGAVLPLSAQDEKLFSNAVQRSLRTNKPDARPKRVGWWLAPVFAACMVVVVAGWFSLRGPGTLSKTAARIPEETISNDEELLENMDLLQEMESVEQLVNLLDKQYPETSLLEGERDADHVRFHA
jgi:anti-sigma factor RsiW